MASIDHQTMTLRLDTKELRAQLAVLSAAADQFAEATHALTAALAATQAADETP